MAVVFAELEDVKAFFGIEDETIDELLEYLIEHYSDVIYDKTGVSDMDIRTKEALFFAIGCHLTKTRLDKISPTIAYTVKNTKERFQNPSTADESWCDLYREAIADILADEAGRVVVIGKKRPGLSDLYGL